MSTEALTSKSPTYATAVTVSPRSSPRQSFSRYTIRAGRNLPDKEFRYLRTVIVTADIHGDLDTELRLAANPMF